MRSAALLAVAALAAHTLAAYPTAPMNQTSILADLARYAKGFRDPSVQSSVGGNAICVSGYIDVTASASNYKIDYAVPANNSEITEFIVEALQYNSTFAADHITGKQDISGTYAIYSQLCFPKSTPASSTLQFLIHGGGFAREYWNNAPGYSYVDYAAAQGYPTFLYDRLGTGLSDRPDGLQVVQTPFGVIIAHELIQKLRSGALSTITPAHIVGVGHSLGSVQTNGLTSNYPKDLDAAVLTGLAVSSRGNAVSFAAFNLQSAATADPGRFFGLPNDYLSSASEAGIQFFFFHEPNFDPALLRASVATAQTLTLGELLTTASVSVSTNFTGPVDFTLGENDMPICLGNCLLPGNLAAAAEEALYPAASNGSSLFIVPGTGHGINYHYSATMAYEHIHGFIRKNGF